MAHLRKQIREAVASACTGLATTSTRVYQSRVYALDSANLPALRIYTLNEIVQAETLAAPQQLQRMVEVVVEGVARATADVDDTLDQIAAEVEVVLGNTTLSSLVRWITLNRTEIEFSREAEQPTGTIRLIYQAEYRTVANDAETAS